MAQLALVQCGCRTKIGAVANELASCTQGLSECIIGIGVTIKGWLVLCLSPDTQVHRCSHPRMVKMSVSENALAPTGGESAVAALGAGWEEGGGAAASSSVRVSCGVSGLCVWVCLVVRVGLCRPPSSWALEKSVWGLQGQSPCECHVYLRRAWCVSGGVSLSCHTAPSFFFFPSISFCCTYNMHHFWRKLSSAYARRDSSLSLCASLQRLGGHPYLTMLMVSEAQHWFMRCATALLDTVFHVNFARGQHEFT